MGQSRPFRPFALIVEDESSQRELISVLLEDSDYVVIERDNAEAAEAVLREHGHQISLLFADVNLAGRMNGAELALVAKQHNPQIEIILTSGYPMRQTLPDGVKFWAKPWAPVDLLREAAVLQSRMI